MSVLTQYRVLKFIAINVSMPSISCLSRSKPFGLQFCPFDGHWIAHASPILPKSRLRTEAEHVIVLLYARSAEKSALA